jgi:hypothetical protein
MIIERLDENCRPFRNEQVQIKKMGNLVEVVYKASHSGGIKIGRLEHDRNSYVVFSSGEVKQFDRTNNRAENMTGVSQSLKRLRELINTNITDADKCRWLTLTYCENMTDHERLYDDFRKFNMRLQYYCTKNKLPKYEYIVAMEPQGRGAWHGHLMLIFDENAPYISNAVLAKIWRHGFVKIKAVKNIDNIGVYFGAYLGDMDLTDEIKINGIPKKSVIKEIEYTGADGKKSKKHIIKGARLKMYPVGFRLFRKSRGIKEPVTYKCTEKEAMREINGAPLKYEKTIRLKTADGQIINTINYRHYNMTGNKNNTQPNEIDVWEK